MLSSGLTCWFSDMNRRKPWTGLSTYGFCSGVSTFGWVPDWTPTPVMSMSSAPDSSRWSMSSAFCLSWISILSGSALRIGSVLWFQCGLRDRDIDLPRV